MFHPPSSLRYTHYLPYIWVLEKKIFVLPLLSEINLSCPHRQSLSYPIKLPGPNEMPCKKSNRPESLRESSRMQKRLPVSWLLG
jgi:hypothetical protein